MIRSHSGTQEAGLQLAVHANGDRMQLEVCRALSAIDHGINDRPRIRVEHARNFMPDFAALTSAWREADIIPVPQPVFIYTFGEFIPHYVGEYARDKQFPQRSLLDDGWRISGSSDVWVGGEIGQTNPFLSIASCVERRTYHGHELSPDQRISVYEGLRMHTLDAAYAMGVEQTPGSLAAGEFADIIALQRNPLKTPATELDSIAVREVFLGGRRVQSSTT